MANFLATIRTAAASLQALQDSVSVSQSNVTNASTPGYARQRLQLASLDFAPNEGLLGGVDVLGLQSARDHFAEAAVRDQVSRLGRAEALHTQLEWIESAVNVTNEAGIGASMDQLFTSFQEWSVAPNSASAKENVFAAADRLATSFNQAAMEVERASTEAQKQIRESVKRINTIATELARHNIARRETAGTDAGADANLHQALDKLSELVDFSIVHQDDGSLTVLLGGSVALVVGENTYPLSTSFHNDDLADQSIPDAHILDATGADVTGAFREGDLAGLIEFQNVSVAKYLGNESSLGELNKLAEAVASRVNTIIAAGRPLTPPLSLFILGQPPTAIARTLKLNPNIQAELFDPNRPDLPDDPVNGIPQQLARLANPLDPADKLDGLSFVSYFGQISSTAGLDVTVAKAEVDTRTALTAQAKSIRSELSGVSLDEEAVQLVQYQRAYQASARIVTILDELTQMAVNMGRN
jgi:flagellar hook-associated protein 1 FlgK